MSWDNIEEVINEARAKNDPCALAIQKLKLEINHISLYLEDPYAELEDSDCSEQENNSGNKIPSMAVDVDLDLSAFANARRLQLKFFEFRCVISSFGFHIDITTRKG